jgi:hypothetical protein
VHAKPAIQLSKNVCFTPGEALISCCVTSDASRQAPDNKKPGVERRAKPSLFSVGTDSRDARLIVYPVFVTDLTPSLLQYPKA